ncbi:MAG: hypothetical protein RL481_115, partial [Pseudomonadota bacterium]
LSEVGVTALGGKVYVIAGSATLSETDYKASTTTVHVYDPATDRWSNAAPLPWATSHAAIAVLGGKIYAVGGFDDIVHIGPQSKFAVYNPKRNNWTELPPLPTARGSIALAAVGGKLHALGGRTSSKVIEVAIPNGPKFDVGIGTVNTHDVFDPAARKWTSAAAIPGEPRDHMGAVVTGGKIHLFGGRVNDFSDMLKRHDVYDPVSRKWSVAAPLAEPRSAGAFTVLDGRIIYAGGECKPGGQPGMTMTFERVEAYNPKADNWVAMPDLPRGNQAFGAATVGKVAYFAGGSPMCGGGGSNDFWALRKK